MNDLARFRQARDFLFEHRTDYAKAYRDFQWPQLEYFNFALDHFDDLARDNHSPALWLVADDGRETQVSYATMSLRSSQVANWLEQLGVQRGERVLLVLGNEVPLWELMLACIKIGAVLIPAACMLSRTDLADRITRGKVSHVVTNRANVDKFEGLADGLNRIVVDGATEGWIDYAQSQHAAHEYVARVPTRADEPLLLYFTSGTTSKPKLVLHTHTSYPVGHLSTLYWIGLKPGDVHWNISSPGWAKHAWSCFFAPWIAGACVFIFEFARFDARRVLDMLVEKSVTTLCAPPTVWRMLIQQDLARYPVRLREVVSAGEPLNPEVIDQVEAAWKLTIRDGFGQTETSAQIGNPPSCRLKPGSMGRPLPGFAPTLLDADGQPAEEGELCLSLSPRPTGLMRGYDGDDVRTAEVMRDGFFHTGDVAMRDEEGYITYVGRADDVFKSSDYRISPFELESVLIEHPAIAEAAVVPSPDALRLAVPKAFISLAAGYEPDEATAHAILAFCREHLTPFKRIRRLEFADLPKTISGKIRRVELRNREAQRELPAAAAINEYFDDAIKS